MARKRKPAPDRPTPPGPPPAPDPAGPAACPVESPPAAESAGRPSDRSPPGVTDPPGGAVYRGRRSPSAAVTVTAGGVERPLPLRLDLRRHSPTGFGWGYAGSGPAQLALALAADALGDDERARRVYQRLKAAVVAGLPSDGWTLTADQVRATVTAIEQGRGVEPAPAMTPDAHPTPDRSVDPPPRPVDRELARSDDGVPTIESDRTPPPSPAGPDRPRPIGASHAAAVRPDGPRTPDPFGFRRDVPSGVRLLENRRYQEVQLRFAEQPSEAVREEVSRAGFRWVREERAWVKPIAEVRGWQTRAEADALFDRVTAMIRAEKGLAHEPG